MFTQEEIRLIFSIPPGYDGFYWEEKGVWLFSDCDSTIKVDLFTCTAVEDHMVCGDSGHYFKKTDWLSGEYLGSF